MGASKEGMMSVRERINLVLKDADPEEGTSRSTDCDASFGEKRGVGGGPSGERKDGISKSLERHHDRLRRSEESPANGQSPESKSLMSNAYNLLVVRQMLQQKLKFIKTLGDQLDESETKVKAVSMERDQLAVALQSEREERTRLQQANTSLLEQKNRADGSIKEKEDMIIELQRQLLIAKTRRPVEEKSTCTTPHQFSSPPNSPPLDQPPLKRVRLSDGNSFVTPPPPPPESALTQQTRLDNVNIPSSSFISFNIRQSNSPPQLSPAVTPKSLYQKNYCGSRSGVNAFSRFDDEESDDLEEELQGLTTTPIQEADKPSSSTSYFEPQDSPVPTSHQSTISRSSSSKSDEYLSNLPFTGESTSNSHHSHLDEYLNSSDVSNFKPIQRPRPNSFGRQLQRHPMQPEVRRRLNAISHIRSRVPDANNIGSLLAPKNFSSDNANNYLSPCSATLSQSQQSISVRNNNFLNLSRPVPSKDLTSLLSTDDFSGGQENHNEPFQSLADFERMNEEEIPETITSPTKKRAVGRPPGSIKKRQAGPCTTVSSPSPGPSTSNSNGVVEQKFSKRGRLLKPNRARYSPDPDISVNSRDKCITTRKSYFMPESTAEEENEVVEEPAPAKPVVEEEPVCPVIDVVEVPKWRINVVEGYEDELDRPIPDDDMSEEAFMKRHQKLEAKEKQRKRWDSQRLREETYREKLRMRQEERDRQKEFRRLQRKRKGRVGCTSDEEQESLLPTIDDVKAIFISPELPVGAFGFTLPLVEKVDFQLLWMPEVRNYINISDKNNNSSDNSDNSTEMATTTVKVLNPSPSSSSTLPPISSQNSELSSSCSGSRSSIPFSDLDTNSARMNSSSVNLSKDKNKRSISSFTDSRICSNTIDAGNGIVVEFDNNIGSNVRTNLISNPSSFDVTTTITITEDVGECGSPTPIFTIDVVDFRSENNTDSNGSSSGSSSGKTNVSDDIDAFSRSSSSPPTSVLPSITIPSLPRYHCESSRSCNSSRKETTCDSVTSKVVDIGLLKVSCPPLSYSVSNTNAVSSPSFKFVIPTNPLAPRQSSPGSSTRPPPMSSLSPPKPGFRSQNNVASSPSRLSPTRTETLCSTMADEMCKDNVRS
ncbi:unnamed protein product [Orchesella dallaii]|uniref:PEHE domain-containing protein n=1 Tax=Orchesella dallaii TaxID=48710 RepID=A0ABP1RE97_9HEXA